MPRYSVQFAYDVEFTRFRIIQVDARNGSTAEIKALRVKGETPHVEWKDTESTNSDIRISVIAPQRRGRTSP